MRSLRAGVLVSAIAMLASMLSVQPASATSTWTWPEVLGAHATDVEMGVNSHGDAVAVWADDTEVKASYRPAGQDWQHPAVLGDGARQVIGAFVDDRGRATAVWWRQGTTTVAERGLDGRWHRDQNAPTTDDCCSNSTPVVEEDGAGHLVMTWQWLNDQIGGSDNLAWRSGTGRWSKVLYGGGDYPALVMPKPGVAVMARGSDGLFTQVARFGESAKPWRRVWPAVQADTPVLAVNDHGDMVLAAVDGDQAGAPLNGAPGRLIVISKPAGEKWREAFVSDVPGKVSDPAVAISDSGRIIVTYQQATDSALMARVGGVHGGSTGVPVQLDSHPQVGPAALAFNPAGDAVAAWTTAGPSGGSVFAARLPASGDWTEPVVLGQSSAAPTVTAYPNGMFTALFIDHRGEAAWRDYVVDHTGPTTRMLAPRRTFVKRARFRVRWAVADALSRPRSTDVMLRRSRRRDDTFGAWHMWKRVDATRRSGIYKGHQSDTICFKARSTDRTGHRGSWSRQRCTAVPRDDSNARLGGHWNRVHRQGAYRDTLTVSRRVGAHLWMRNVYARSLKLFVRTSRHGGTIHVRYAGHDLGLFPLRSRHTRDRVITLAHLRHRGSGLLRIRVVRRGPVRIDGLAIIR